MPADADHLLDPEESWEIEDLLSRSRVHTRKGDAQPAGSDALDEAAPLAVPAADEVGPIEAPTPQIGALEEEVGAAESLRIAAEPAMPAEPEAAPIAARQEPSLAAPVPTPNLLSAARAAVAAAVAPVPVPALAQPAPALAAVSRPAIFLPSSRTDDAPARINRTALGWTLGIHAVVIMLCIFFKYTLPARTAPPEELGIEVNLGTSEDGFGADQPEEPGDPAPDNAAFASAAMAPSEDAASIHTDDRDAPEVTPRKPAPTRAQPQEHPSTTNPRAASATATRPAQTPRPEPPRQPKYVMPGATGPGGNGAQGQQPGGAEGNTSGSGDRGVPGGTPGAPNYTGTPGRGTGGRTTSLAGRRIISGSLSGTSSEVGTVVVRVTVNRAGVIVSSGVKSATSAALRSQALQQLRSVRYNPAPDAPEEQFGTLTFRFRLP